MATAGAGRKKDVRSLAEHPGLHAPGDGGPPQAALRRTLLGSIPLAAAVLLWPGSADALTPAAFRAALASRYEALERAGVAVVRGSEGWYFLARELRSYSRGRFWGEDSLAASAAGKDRDPLGAILEFNDMLARVGVRLIVVPVPGKVCVYADKLDPTLASETRLDEYHQEFFALLSKEGVEIVDLLPDFLAMRRGGTAPYCMQDTHWSPQAVRLAASRVAALVRREPWYAGARKVTPTVTRREIEVRGDLAAMLKDESAPKERLVVEEVRLDGRFMESDRSSPLVLAGDSHSLVYHRALLAEGAGLADLLCAELGLTVDVVGVQGSGANGSRAALARRRDNLAGKKCVVWCFSAREFTESFEGWKRVPVVR